eukprot:5508635-Amphidinium_carterae.3
MPVLTIGEHVSDAQFSQLELGKGSGGRTVESSTGDCMHSSQCPKKPLPSCIFMPMTFTAAVFNQTEIVTRDAAQERSSIARESDACQAPGQAGTPEHESDSGQVEMAHRQADQGTRPSRASQPLAQADKPGHDEGFDGGGHTKFERSRSPGPEEALTRIIRSEIMGVPETTSAQSVRAHVRQPRYTGLRRCTRNVSPQPQMIERPCQLRPMCQLRAICPMKDAYTSLATLSSERFVIASNPVQGSVAPMDDPCAKKPQTVLMMASQR